MTANRWNIVGIVLLGLASQSQAGLYYSGEKMAPLPAQWRGYLLDHRALRNLAIATPGEPGPLRRRYLEEANRLQKRLDTGTLDADEFADLGAIYLRLGETERALAILRPASGKHPNHFHLVANLGTAWQLLGNMEQAAEALQRAVRLAPGKDVPFEEAHLKLVVGRIGQKKSARPLDDLFGVRYQSDSGGFEPGKLAEAQRKKLPARAVAIVQQLALWLPADGTLLWQLAELAAVHGELRSAAAMMDGCITQFNMDHPDLRNHRKQLRVAADELPKLTPGAKAEHEEHRSNLAFRSRRPILNKFDSTPLPAISDSGNNVVPWELFAETTVEQPFAPNFPSYLQELVGKKVELTGFMVPAREEDESAGFLLIESPIGCWYCEMPELAGIVYVELPTGQTTRLQRGLVRIVGRLSLNMRDPEDFLFTLRDARIGGID